MLSELCDGIADSIRLFINRVQIDHRSLDRLYHSILNILTQLYSKIKVIMFSLCNAASPTSKLNLKQIHSFIWFR